MLRVFLDIGDKLVWGLVVGFEVEGKGECVKYKVKDEFEGFFVFL